jgi:hypothetical protein
MAGGTVVYSYNLEKDKKIKTTEIRNLYIPLFLEIHYGPSN